MFYTDCFKKTKMKIATRLESKIISDVDLLIKDFYGSNVTTS